MPDFIQKINRITGALVSILMGFMVLDVSWQVFTRFVLRRPSPFSEEVAGFFLIWVSILGAAYAFYKKAHLGIDILTSKTKGLKRQALEVIVNLIILCFALFIMVVGGLKLVILTFELNQISPAVGIPMGYVYSVIPVSGILIVLYSIGFIIFALKDKNRSILSNKKKMNGLFKPTQSGK